MSRIGRENSIIWLRGIPIRNFACRWETEKSCRNAKNARRNREGTLLLQALLDYSQFCPSAAEISTPSVASFVAWIIHATWWILMEMLRFRHWIRLWSWISTVFGTYCDSNYESGSMKKWIGNSYRGVMIPSWIPIQSWILNLLVILIPDPDQRKSGIITPLELTVNRR